MREAKIIYLPIIAFNAWVTTLNPSPNVVSKAHPLIIVNTYFILVPMVIRDVFLLIKTSSINVISIPNLLSFIFTPISSFDSLFFLIYYLQVNVSWEDMIPFLCLNPSSEAIDSCKYINNQSELKQVRPFSHVICQISKWFQGPSSSLS